MGGKAALANDVAVALENQGLAVRRLAGTNRYSTALRVAEEAVEFPESVVVVTGENFPDAVSASAYAASNRWPIILTPTASVPQDVLDYLAAASPQSAIIVGGEGAVSASAADQIDAVTPVAMRLFGPNRYATSHAVASQHIGGTTSTVWLATGVNYPDALAAGVATAATTGVLALTPTDSTDVAGPDVRDFVEHHRECESRGPLNAGVLVGGKAALSGLVGEQLLALLTCQPFPEPPPECHPAYPSLCVPPPPPQLDCSDVSAKDFPVDHAHGDPHNFDEDGDGVGCESPEPPPPSNCHPAYPDFCIPPPPPDLDCGDFSQKRFTVLHQHGDPHRLDRDKNGVACES